MARIRTVKPGLFRHEELFELEKKAKLPIRIAWVGLFTVADREGRFEWKPNVLKLDVLPWDDIDFAKVLDALSRAGFIRQYEVDGKLYGYIPTWALHQTINQRESESNLPPPNEEKVHARASTCVHMPAHGEEEKEEEEEEEGQNKPAETSSAANYLLLEDEFTKPMLDRVKLDVQEAWIETYGDPEWIKFEIKKAITWCKAKPKRAPKSGYQKFLTSWLARGWESYRKKLVDPPERNTKPISLEDIA